MEYLTQKQAAELKGVTVRRLQQIDAESDSPPPRTEKAKYPAREYGQWLIAQATGDSYDYNKERARLTKAQADEKELQVKILEGDLVPSDQVLDMLQSVIANARAKLLTLPVKAAQAAVSATDLKDIEREIQDLVYESLSELDNGYSGNSKKGQQDMVPASTLNS